jgi:hypothetical protein
MVLTIIILFLSLLGYSFYLINKQNKKIKSIEVLYKKDIDTLTKYVNKNKESLLNEILKKTKENKEYLKKELHEVNKINQTNLKEKQQQLVLGEMKNLRSDVNKDLNNIVESVRNIKVI